jgi:hypothetical protein
MKKKSLDLVATVPDPCWWLKAPPYTVEENLATFQETRSFSFIPES